MDCSSEVIVVTNHTEFGCETFARIAPAGVVGVLITNAAVVQMMAFEKAGVRITKV